MTDAPTHGRAGPAPAQGVGAGSSVGGGPSETFEEPGPPVGGVEDPAGRLRVLAQRLEAAVLELDPRRGRPFGDEAHLELGHGPRVVPPLAGDLPGEDDSVGRVPGEDPAPLALGPVLPPLVPASTLLWLDDDDRPDLRGRRIVAALPGSRARPALGWARIEVTGTICSLV